MQNKFNIREQTPKYLDGDTKLLTTQCAIQETAKLGMIGHSCVSNYEDHCLLECDTVYFYLKMEAVCFSETLIPISQTTW